MCDKHEAILSVLLRGSVSRAWPDDLEAVREVICTSSNPVRIVGHWGAGQKVAPNKYDRRVLNRLQWIMDETGGKIVFHLLLADEHARLNGIAPETYVRYLEQIVALAGDRGITTDWLSHLWPKWGVQEPFGEVLDGIWSQYPLAPVLEKRAARHHHGERSPREDAKRYYAMTQIEGPAIAEAFPNALWFTYGESQFRDLYPPMPRIYLWPYKKGRSNAPWFS